MMIEFIQWINYSQKLIKLNEGDSFEDKNKTKTRHEFDCDFCDRNKIQSLPLGPARLVIKTVTNAEPASLLVCCPPGLSKTQTPQPNIGSCHVTDHVAVIPASFWRRRESRTRSSRCGRVRRAKPMRVVCLLPAQRHGWGAAIGILVWFNVVSWSWQK